MHEHLCSSFVHHGVGGECGDILKCDCCFDAVKLGALACVCVCVVLCVCTIRNRERCRIGTDKCVVFRSRDDLIPPVSSCCSTFGALCVPGHCQFRSAALVPRLDAG